MIQLNTTNYCFIKAVKPEFAKDYFNKGEIFFNTIGYFQDLEKNDANVGDNKENIFINWNKGFMYFSPKKINTLEEIPDLIKFGNKVSIENLQGSFKNYKDVIHCVCFSSFKIEKNGEHIRFELNPKFFIEYSGCRFFLIHDYELYLNKINSTLKKLRYDKIYRSPVKYFNKTTDFINLTGNPFKKREKFKYQNEYRILVKKKHNWIFSYKYWSIIRYGYRYYIFN